MRMMMMGGNPLAMVVGPTEDEIAFQRAIEESKNQNPNPDNMTYEQLLELGDKLGKVSKGLKKEQIAKIPGKLYRQGQTKSTNCSICYEEFTLGVRFKQLKDCGHEYHDTCINKWLEEDKRCPVCNKTVNIS